MNTKYPHAHISEQKSLFFFALFIKAAHREIVVSFSALSFSNICDWQAFIMYT